MSDRPQDAGPSYTCPMHPQVRQPGPGKCPTCGMDLILEGVPFAMLRHLTRTPTHLLVMAALMATAMVALMVAAMITTG